MSGSASGCAGSEGTRSRGAGFEDVGLGCGGCAGSASGGGGSKGSGSGGGGCAGFEGGGSKSGGSMRIEVSIVCNKQRQLGSKRRATGLSSCLNNSIFEKITIG